jgi:hypothetical protein
MKKIKLYFNENYHIIIKEVKNKINKNKYQMSIYLEEYKKE